MNWHRLFCSHAHRDQGIVGYCARCGHFKRLDKNGYLWTRYVAPPDPAARPPGLPPRVR